MELKSGDGKKEKNWNHYKQDISDGLGLERYAKIHNSGRDKSGTDQHRGRLQGPQISRKDKK